MTKRCYNGARTLGNTLVHMVCTTSALIYYQSFTNGVHPMCTSSALCVTLSSVSTVSSTVARETLLNLGFLLAKEKCQWIPEQQVTWLGHNIDMSIAKVLIIEERIKRLETAIESLLYQIDKDQ